MYLFSPYTKKEVRSRDSSHFRSSSDTLGRTGRENRLRGGLCLLLPVRGSRSVSFCVCARARVCVCLCSRRGEVIIFCLPCLHPTPELKHPGGRGGGGGGNGVSRQGRAEGSGAAHRGGRLPPQEGLSGTQPHDTARGGHFVLHCDAHESERERERERERESESESEREREREREREIDCF